MPVLLPMLATVDRDQLDPATLRALDTPLAPVPQASQPLLSRWIYALKLMSWPKVLVPTLLGQALGVAVNGGCHWRGLAFGLLYTAAYTAYLVLLNDWGDRHVDGIKRRLFPRGCSPKTIPDGILPARALLIGGLLALALTVAVGVVGGILIERPHVALIGALGPLVFMAYTFPPLRLNYRGGGEYLEMLGAGFILPYTNACTQAPVAWADAYWILVGTTLLGLSSAIASGLSDEVSDRLGGKRTIVTQWGNLFGRRAVEWIVMLAAVAWAVTALLVETIPLAGMLVVLVAMIWPFTRMLEGSRAAVTSAFKEQGRYKKQLHRAIWQSSLALSIVLLVVGYG